MLLGANQALTWSMTVNMMVDLVPADRRGFAAGVNEFSGYLGVSLLAFLTGLVAAAANFKDGLVWLALPLTMAARGFDLALVGAVAAVAMALVLATALA